MATLTITIPDAQVDRVSAALGWPSAALPNETRAQMVRRVIISQLRAQVSEWETDKLRIAVVPPTTNIT